MAPIPDGGPTGKDKHLPSEGTSVPINLNYPCESLSLRMGKYLPTTLGHCFPAGVYGLEGQYRRGM